MSLSLLMKGQDYSATPAEVTLRSLLGGLLIADWRQSLIARGYGWHTDVGAFSTPITGGGNGTVLDQDQPEFSISVPANYTLIPLRFDIQCSPGVQTTDDHETEVLIALDRAAAQDGTGTATAETPVNMRTSAASGCPATVRSAYTADATNPTLGVELARAFTRENFGDATGTELVALPLLYEPHHPPFCVGPCCIYGYWGGDIAATGFAQLEFLVIATSLISGLS